MGVAQVRTKKRASTGTRKREYQSPIDKAHGAELDWTRCGPVFEAARLLEKPSFVYVVGEEEDGPVKIGVAVDPIKRLREMQTGNSRRLRLEAVVIGDRRTVEALLHEIWEPFAIRSIRKRGKIDTRPGTEWFEPGIRADLFVALETAAEDQIRYLDECEAYSFPELARIVLTAHRKHDLEVHRRDEVILLAQGAGYVAKRHSIIQRIDEMIDEAAWQRQKAA